MPLWTSNGSGSWLTANRWSGNSIPNAAGAEAEFTVNTEAFGIYQISIPTNTTVTIGTLNIVSSSLDGYSILSALGATNAFLRFQGVGGSPAFINVDSNGSQQNNIRNTVGMGVVFASDVILTTINSDTFYQISAPISGSGDLNKYGTGTLSLTGNNSAWAGDINLLGGRTEASAAALSIANVELNNGAILVTSSTVANRIEVGATSAIGTIATGAGQILTLSGNLVLASNSANAVRFGETGVVGTIVLTGTSTIIGIGGFAIVSGIVQLGNAGVAANYFSNLTPLATFSVIGTFETRGFATSIDNLDMDGGTLRAGTGVLDVTVTDTTNGGNSQSGTIEGSAGVDRIVINASTNFSLAGATFVNWSANDTITINGSAGVNNLTGSSQNDVLNGGAGADTMIGGGGDDVYFVDTMGDVVTEVAGQGFDEVRTSVSGYVLPANVESLVFTSAAGGILLANAINNVVVGGAGADLFRLEQGGSDQAFGNGGADGFFFGGQMTAADQVDGGEGSDQLALQGIYPGLTFGAASLVSVESVVLLPGNDTRFIDPGGALLSYNLTTVDANVAAGQVLTFQANTLRTGENFTLNGSAETNGFLLTFGGLGTDNLTGGQQGDGFYFGTGRFNVTDVVDGQGGSDQLGLQGDFAEANALTFGATQLTSVEFIVLLGANDTRFGGGSAGQFFNYTLTMDNGNVAAGQQMNIQANTLRPGETLRFDGSAETDGSFRVFGGGSVDVITGSQLADDIFGNGGGDRITGLGGADMLRGGADADIFGYSAISESTAAARDRLLDFATGDLIDLSLVDANANVAGLQSFQLVGSGAAFTAAGQLRISQAGNVALVEGDSDGDGMADFAIEVNVAGGHSLSAADFLGLAPGAETLADRFGAVEQAEAGGEGAVDAWLWQALPDVVHDIHFLTSLDLAV